MPEINLYHKDCMEAMAEMEDNQFDLVISDPPYGITQPAFRKESKNKLAKTKNYNHLVFNQKAPGLEWFNEVFRVSKNQIIWGAQFYNSYLPVGKQWIFWDKGTEATQWGDGELAFTSFKGAMKKFTFTWNGMLQGDMKNKEDRIHPTQKPVALYKYLLKNYAKPGDRILDTHAGSFSIGIACHDMGFDLDAYEIDKDYYEAAMKRFNQHKAQLQLF